MNSAAVLPKYDSFEHYKLNTGPTDEFGDLPESPPTIRNIGWTLGNEHAGVRGFVPSRGDVNRLRHRTEGGGEINHAFHLSAVRS